ncbi:translation initiation factor IF-2 [Tilletia horrida]|nr:translation initiation factor IF-2 [Tilletia horrida]
MSGVAAAVSAAARVRLGGRAAGVAVASSSSFHSAAVVLNDEDQQQQQQRQGQQQRWNGNDRRSDFHQQRQPRSNQQQQQQYRRSDGASSQRQRFDSGRSAAFPQGGPGTTRTWTPRATQDREYPTNNRSRQHQGQNGGGAPQRRQNQYQQHFRIQQERSPSSYFQHRDRDPHRDPRESSSSGGGGGQRIPVAAALISDQAGAHRQAQVLDAIDPDADAGDLPPPSAGDYDGGHAASRRSHRRSSSTSAVDPDTPLSAPSSAARGSAKDRDRERARRARMFSEEADDEPPPVQSQRSRTRGVNPVRETATSKRSSPKAPPAPAPVVEEPTFDIHPRPRLAPSSPEHAQLPLRPPVVTIMGHVDHGKTTLLDKLRSTSVAAGEAGGITQHIGAFSVPVVFSSSSAEGESSSSSSSGTPQFVTFLDTPGHAAFTAMRSRGASVTDIVVLVVAADDGVMPQTREVIELWKELSAREAQYDPASAEASSSSASSSTRRLGSGSLQLVVALTKSDKRTADPERVKRQLLVEGIELEEYGGEVPCVPVSGKTGEGLDLLQDTLVTLAELAELRAEREGPVEGYIVESKVEKGRGSVATVLVKRGALKVGDIAVAGTTWVKVRSLTDSSGASLRELKPGQAGVVTGWKELPSAGDEILGASAAEGGENAAKRAVEGRKRRLEAAKLGEEAAQISEQRRLLAEEQERKKRSDFLERQQRRLAEAALAAGKSVEELVRESKAAAGAGQEGEDGDEDADEAATLGTGKAESEKKELLVIVKADVSGSVEAVIGAISGIGNKEAGVRIVSSGVGEPTDGDLAMAKAVGARIICFNVNIPRAIERAAASHSPPIQLHSSPIIYRLMEYVSASVGSLLPPLRQIRVTGEALIAQIFKINVKGRVFVNVAGCRVTNGTIARSSEVRILRSAPEDVVADEEEEEGGEGAEGGDGNAGLKVGDRVGGGRRVVWLGKLDSLKHGKNEVPDRGKGTECGMSFEGFQAFEEGDVVQCFYTVDVPRQLM